jgi:xylitol oxidase
MAEEEFDVSRGCPGYERNLECNWNGNVSFGGNAVMPKTIAELCEVVKTCPAPVRVVGRGHSFSPVAECAGGTLLSLSRLDGITAFTPPENGRLGSITMQGGTTYTQVAQYLGTRGALRNLPSCPQFTVAGAIATATHGSGIAIPNLAAEVSMLEFVLADGTLKRYSRDGDDESRRLLEGCRVHLGCLGVISSLTLDVVPYFEVESVRYDDVPLERALANLPLLWEICDSLSVWTSGFGRGHGTGTCWLTMRYFKDPSDASVSHIPLSKDVLGDTGKLCEKVLPRYCSNPDKPLPFKHTCRGPWHDVLPLTFHEGQETTMEKVDLQAEFFVPLGMHRQALRAVWDVAREWSFSSQWGYEGTDGVNGDVDAMEFRQVKGGDGGWLSPHAVDSLGIHVSFNGSPDLRSKVSEDLLPALEKALQPFKTRAHWGKLASRTFVHKSLVELYGEDLIRFQDLCNKHDPAGKFQNKHTRQMLLGESIF